MNAQPETRTIEIKLGFGHLCDGDEPSDITTVEATIYGQYGVHRTVSYKNDTGVNEYDPEYWTVTHLLSGVAIVRFMTKREATRIAKKLRKGVDFDTPWTGNYWNTPEMVQRIGEVVYAVAPYLRRNKPESEIAS